MSTNGDFVWRPDAHQLLAEQSTPDGQIRGQTERDRQIEDYLNRHVLRRLRAVDVAGNASDHASATYIDVVPATTLTYPKAAANSVLAVTVHAHGKLQAAAAAGWIAWAVSVSVDGGTSLGDYPAASTDFAAAQVGMYLGASGTVEIAGVARGAVVLTLRTKNDAATTTWRSSAHSTLSIACVETHGP